MLIAIAEAFDTSVGTLLDETAVQEAVDDLKAISQKLEIIDLQEVRL
jgi:hypothetical protein